MIDWQLREVPLKFGIGDRILMTHTLPLQVFSVKLADAGTPADAGQAPGDPLLPGSQGYYCRALPIAEALPRRSRIGDWVRYVTAEYVHCYIDMSCGLEAYRAKFSSKTRSTINRKLRKFQDHCQGKLDWRVYDRADQMPDYYLLARQVSTRTYQEKLLDAGMPAEPGYLAELIEEASQQRVRGYLLFDGEQPVAYLHCPIRDDSYVYAYLGYDPDYMKLSVGTVLQWLALEDLFGRPAARFFDFTEGQSEHKRLFATHERRCANVMFVRATPINRLWLGLHGMAQDASSGLGRLAERLGLKARVRRLLRFGLVRPGAMKSNDS